MNLLNEIKDLEKKLFDDAQAEAEFRSKPHQVNSIALTIFQKDFDNNMLRINMLTDNLLHGKQYVKRTYLDLAR